MSTTTEPLLSWLREMMSKKGMNTAAMSDAADVPRPRLRKLLTGREPMLVSELLGLCEALEVTPADMGLPGVPAGDVDDVSPDDDEPAVESANEPTPHEPLDPLGNHPQQLFESGFALGCDFLFLVKADALEGSGIPQHVLKQYDGRDLPIKLDAAYHRYNAPKYSPEEVEITLSFDSLYTCRFPWSGIHQMVFFPATPEAPEEPSQADEDESPAGPFLRLVK